MMQLLSKHTLLKSKTVKETKACIELVLLTQGFDGWLYCFIGSSASTGEILQDQICNTRIANRCRFYFEVL